MQLPDKPEPDGDYAEDYRSRAAWSRSGAAEIAHNVCVQRNVDARRCLQRIKSPPWMRAARGSLSWPSEPAPANSK